MEAPYDLHIDAVGSFDVRSIAGVAALCALVACSPARDRAAEAVSAAKATVSARLTGRAVPNVVVPRLGDGTGSLAEYRGRAVLANLWATWCGPCKREMPALQRLSEAYRARGFVVVGIDDGEPASIVKRFVRSVEVTYPILLDSDMRYATAFSILGLPTSVFVRNNGIVDDAITGELSYSRMKRSTDRLLGDAK